MIIKLAKRLDLNYFHNKIENIIMRHDITIATVAITSQFINVSNQHVVQLKCTQCYIKYISGKY